jgi:hypothetical protein
MTTIQFLILLGTIILITVIGTILLTHNYDKNHLVSNIINNNRVDTIWNDTGSIHYKYLPAKTRVDTVYTDTGEVTDYVEEIDTTFKDSSRIDIQHHSYLHFFDLDYKPSPKSILYYPKIVTVETKSDLSTFEGILYFSGGVLATVGFQKLIK